VIWSLYSPKSAADKGTLYQLRTILDRRNVVADPKRDFNACHGFLETVIDGYITSAACTIFGVKQPSQITMEMMFSNGIPESDNRRDIMKGIECIAREIEDKFTGYSTSSIPPTTDGIFNYSRLVLSMGLLARDFRDSWKEGDGPQSIRLWKFLLLHYKQSGHTKYANEAVRLLAAVKATLTPKESFELTWNRTCSTRNGIANNIPLDLHNEHLNRMFKDDLKTFHSHLSEKSVNKTANATTAVYDMLSNFDEELKLKADIGKHSEPDIKDDVMRVVDTLMNTSALSVMPNRFHPHFPCVPREPFSGVNYNKFKKWLINTRKQMAVEAEHNNFKNL
jgi:L1 cell adhesion molecule like protein